MSDVCASIHRGMYGRSDKVNAPENANAEFQAGYARGLEISEAMDEITAEWERRGSPEELSEGFREWKRGLWAAHIQTALLPAREARERRGR